MTQHVSHKKATTLLTQIDTLDPMNENETILKPVASTLNHHLTLNNSIKESLTVLKTPNGSRLNTIPTHYIWPCCKI